MEKQVQHGNANTNGSGAAGCTTLAGALTGEEADAAIGFSLASIGFPYRPLPSLSSSLLLSRESNSNAYFFLGEIWSSSWIPFNSCERERERESLAREFYSKNPTPPGAAQAFIQEGNRAPVSKATHSRYRKGPVRPRVRR